MFSRKTIIIGSTVIFAIFALVVSVKTNAPKTKLESIESTQNTKLHLPSKRVIYQGNRNKPEIALTFDADMTPGMKDQLVKGQIKSWYNDRVIEILKKTQTPATLFLTGMWIETYTDTSRQLAQNSLFELANHSYSHPGFTPNCYKLKSIPDSQDLEQLEKTQKLLKELTGTDNHLFRFPGGCFDQKDLKIVYSLNLLPIQWDVVSGDAFNNNTDQIVKNVLNKSQNGSVVVFHLNGGPNAPQTDKALPAIIQGLRKKGFVFVKLSQMLAELQ